MAVVLESMQTAVHLGQVTSWDDSWWLVIDADLEASRAPVHKLHRPLALDGGDGSVDVLGHNVTPVEHAAGHVLAMTGVALHHGVRWLKASVGNLSHRELLMVSLFCRDDGSVGDQRKVDPGIGHQVGLKLVEVHIKSSIESH